MNVVYFQPKNINPKYCERGTIPENDPEYIWHLDEPYKILISEVKIIDKENVTYNRKTGLNDEIMVVAQVINIKYWQF